MVLLHLKLYRRPNFVGYLRPIFIESFQVDIKSSGEVLVAAGESTNVFLDIALDITGTYDLTHGKIYAGSLGHNPAHWLLCRE